MPLLSIIIPYQKDDATLERTILSVLENQPENSEIIVVHDGTYSDPYDLGDELLFVQKETANPVSLINAGLVEASAPIVCLLCNGAVVQGDNWADKARIQLLENRRLVALSTDVTVMSPANSSPANSSQKADVLGICLSKLESQPVFGWHSVQPDHADGGAAPRLACGFYSRHALMALGGWNEHVGWEIADIELAMLICRLGLECGTVTGKSIQVSIDRSNSLSRKDVWHVAALANSYGLRNSSPIIAASDFARGFITGETFLAASWAHGLLSKSYIQSAHRRRKLALDRLRKLHETKQAVSSYQPEFLKRAA